MRVGLRQSSSGTARRHLRRVSRSCFRSTSEESRRDRNAGAPRDAEVVDLTKARVQVGRTAPADVVIQDFALSRRQCELVFRSDGAFIVDNKSACGTFVNGRKITRPVRLKVGDKIYIADHVLELLRLP